MCLIQNEPKKTCLVYVYMAILHIFDIFQCCFKNVFPSLNFDVEYLLHKTCKLLLFWAIITTYKSLTKKCEFDFSYFQRC